MKNGKSRIVIIIMIFIIGLLILVYPFVSDWYNTKNFLEKVSVYEEEVNFLPKETLEKEWKLATDYNNSLKGEPVKDPFVEGSGTALPENYLNVLNINDTMAVLEIPSIDVKLPVYHGTDQEILKKGLGHIEGTFLPIGTEGGHAFITGHTGLPTAKLLTDLIELEEGNEFYIKVLDKELTYQVDEITTVTPDEFSQLPPDIDGDYVTLVTCTPYGVNSHRLLVRGTRVYHMSKVIQITEHNSYLWEILMGLSGSLIVITSCVLVINIKRKRQLDKREVILSNKEGI
ncbi:MAG: class C sortase [Coprobacillaceae bacterium]